MTTYEWVMLLVVLLGGFWTLNRSLTKIEIALSGKVGYNDCEDRQDKCPCHAALAELKKKMEEMHPPQKG